MSSRTECTEALAALGQDEIKDAASRRDLLLMVTEYIEQLERMVRERDEKLKEIVEKTVQAPAREREVVGRFWKRGEVLLLHVPAYDLAWFCDLAAQGQIDLTLRPEGQVDLVDGTPTVFVVVDSPQPKDFLLTLRVLTFGERDSGEGEALFSVLSLTEAAELELEVEPAITAKSICEAVESGKVKARIRRTPSGIEVHFEDPIVSAS